MVIRHRCQEVALFSARVRRRAFLERLGIKGDLMSRLKRYIALDGVAARMARGAKPVQISSRENGLADTPVTI